MCGLVGYFSPTRTRTDLGPLAEAAALIRHRGPDDEGYAAFDLATGATGPGAARFTAGCGTGCRSWGPPRRCRTTWPSVSAASPSST